LTNYEYRIFPKVLANRLKKIGECLVDESQTCSIQSRRIGDGINTIRDIMYDSNIKKMNFLYYQ
jgi:hypothetical protein